MTDVLLSHIYGPYPELILKANFPGPRNKVVMNDLRLFFHGDPEPTGFDETEYITTPPSGSRIATNPHIVFFGVIEINDLDWLSDKGLEYLGKDFQHKAKTAQLHGLTLENIYLSRKPHSPRLKVRLSCRKSLLAHFLTSKTDSDRLMIYSQCGQIKRTYIVESCYFGTLLKSQNFLERYRLRALVAEMIELDPAHTPLEDRDIEWAIQQYYQTILPRDKNRREFKEPDHIYASRRLRHIPRAYIRSLLAEHAEWLLAHMIARKQGSAKLLDVPKWISFCEQARRDSIEAKRAGQQWGNYSFNPKDSLARNLAKFGQTQKFWEDQLRIIKKRRQKQDVKPRKESSEINIDQPRDSCFQYDSDFSEDSTSEDWDLEAEEALNYKIPGFCFETPCIPAGHFSWNCPGCNHTIDLLNIPPDQINILPADARNILNSSWTMEDAPIQRALQCLVSNHYESHHLSQYRVFASHSNPLKWKINHAHAFQQGRRHNPGIIKVEEPVSQPLRRSNRPPCPRRFSE